MRHILIPVIKVIMMLVFYLIFFPLFIFCCLLLALWYFNFKDLKEFLAGTSLKDNIKWMISKDEF